MKFAWPAKPFPVLQILTSTRSVSSIHARIVIDLEGKVRSTLPRVGRRACLSCSYLACFVGGRAGGYGIAGLSCAARLLPNSLRGSSFALDLRLQRARIVDLNSMNGTFVNDGRIHDGACPLRSGDTVRFGYDKETYR